MPINYLYAGATIWFQAFPEVTPTHGILAADWNLAGHQAEVDRNAKYGLGALARYFVPFVSGTETPDWNKTLPIGNIHLQTAKDYTTCANMFNAQLHSHVNSLLRQGISEDNPKIQEAKALEIKL